VLLSANRDYFPTHCQPVDFIIIMCCVFFLFFSCFIWYPGLPPFSAFLVPRTPSLLSLSGTADSLPSQPFWYRGLRPFSAFLVPRTPSLLSLSGTADSLPFQPFWYRGLRPFSAFLVPWTPSPVNISGSVDSPPPNHLIHFNYVEYRLTKI
jgi:hypothetical protein